MQYRIKYVSCGHVLSTETRKQFPAAIDRAWAAVRGMLEGNGLLDRPVAYKMLRTVSRLTRDVQSATIALDEHSAVTIERIGG